MNIKEIRIGNYVYDTMGKVNQVCVETFVKFNYQITPIPIIILIGSLDLQYFDCIPRKEGCDNIKCYDISFSVDGDIYNCERKNEIIYVHEVQNLVYALTGYELSIK
jgi:hypothetical protein